MVQTRLIQKKLIAFLAVAPIALIYMVLAMVHPKVFLEFGYDPEEVTGIAFGFGTTRMAAQRAGVTKSRTLYEQDVRVHRSVHRGGGEL